MADPAAPESGEGINADFEGVAYCATWPRELWDLVHRYPPSPIHPPAPTFPPGPPTFPPSPIHPPDPCIRCLDEIFAAIFTYGVSTQLGDAEAIATVQQVALDRIEQGVRNLRRHGETES